MRLAYNDHSQLALQILGDLGHQLNSGSKIQNLHFISSFPDSRFLDEVLGQKGLENIRYWRRQLAQPDLVEEMQKLKSSQLTYNFFMYWKVLHHQLNKKPLSILSREANGIICLSSDELDGYVWGFLGGGVFTMQPATAFPSGRTLWTFQ